MTPALHPRAARSEPPLAASPTVGSFAASDAPKVDSSPVPGSRIERVRGSVIVDASIDKVRAVVFDFPRYPEFMPRYQRASIARRHPSGGLDVRMDISELAGAVRVWVRVEVSAAERAGNVERYKGRLLTGNVKAFQTGWELESLSPTKTRLTISSFMDPDLPLVPSTFVNSGARDRIRDVVPPRSASERGCPSIACWP